MELSLILKRVWRGRRILRYILHSVFFNFHYLPFHEAVKLPILLYKPKLLKLKGTIKIKQEDKIGFGMIRLGFPEVSLYPNTGIVFENYGGTVVFKGQCCIGNNSYLSIGPKAIVEFGNRFSATTTFRLTSYMIRPTQIPVTRKPHNASICVCFSIFFSRKNCMVNTMIPTKTNGIDT